MGHRSGEQGLAFRNYTFRAGWLRGRQLRNLTDQQLERATRENVEYINVHSNPTAMCRHPNTGRRVRVAMLPPGKAEERVRLAQRALDFCRAEKDYRQEEEALSRDEMQVAAPPERPDPAEMLAGVAEQLELQQPMREFLEANGAYTGWQAVAEQREQVIQQLTKDNSVLTGSNVALQRRVAHLERSMREYADMLEAGAEHVAQLANALTGMKRQVMAMHDTAAGREL